MESTREKVRRVKAKRSLLDFTCYTKADYEVNWHHRATIEKVEQWIAGEIPRLIICMPPRMGKTEIVSRRTPAYILGRDPDASVIATSYGADLAARVNRDVQLIIDSPAYSNVFPDTQINSKNIRTVAGNTWLRNNDIFEVVDHKGVYKCAGVGGAITGHGCKYGIIDDPVKNREEANSPTYRDKIWNWYNSTFLTRLEKDGRVLITHTRWHEDDLVGRLLALADADPNADQWEVLWLPGIAEGELHESDPREHGEPLWPNKYDHKDMRKTRASLGSYDWSSLYQQNPTPLEGGILKRHWWRFWHMPENPLPPVSIKNAAGESVSIQSTPLPKRFSKQAASWDMAFKDSKSSSYVVGQVWGSVDANRYLLDQDRDHYDFPATVRAVETLHAKHKTPTIYVEDKANGAAVIATLKDKISGIIPVLPKGGKQSRAEAVTAQIEAGNVYLPHPFIAPWVWDFIEECAAFPNATHDDQVDAMTQALNELRTNAPKAVTLGVGDFQRSSPNIL